MAGAAVAQRRTSWLCGGACVDTLADSEHCGGCDNPCDQVCVQGRCATGLGNCASPIVLPAEGGTFPVEFPPQRAESVGICDLVYLDEYRVVFSWTPARSGLATFRAVTASSPLVRFHVAPGPTCPAYEMAARRPCGNRDAPLATTVVAGSTYFIVFATIDDPLPAFAEFAIEVDE